MPHLMNALPLCILKNEHKKTRSNTRRTNLACVTCSIVPRGLIKEVVVVQAINCMPITIMFRWNKRLRYAPLLLHRHKQTRNKLQPETGQDGA